MSLRHQKPKTPPKMTTITTMLVLGLFGGASANAVGLSSVTDAISGFVMNALGQASQNTGDAFLVTTTQTSMAPPAIQGAMTDATNMKEVLSMSEDQAHRIRDVIADYSFAQQTTTNPETGEPVRPIIGAGLSSGLGCKAQAEKTISLTKDELKRAEDFNASSRLAQLYTNDAGTKRRNRIARHLNNYCDITETASGICPLQASGMGSADADYSRFYASDALSVEGVDASVAFTLNISDPLQSNVEGCDAPICNQITAVNTAYQALSNVAQGAFVSQMNDRMYYEFRGVKAGKDLGTDTNIKDGSAGLEQQAPVGENETVVDNGEALYFGDSIADGYKKNANGQGVTNVGDSPKAVYEKLKAYVESNPDALKGKTVVLSTGLSNDTSDYDSIKKQLKLLKEQGANVYVLGVSNNYKGEEKLGLEMNQKLQSMSSAHGFKFKGGFTPSSDNVHPSSYSDLKLVAPKPPAPSTEGSDANKDGSSKDGSTKDAETKDKSKTGAKDTAKTDAKGTTKAETKDKAKTGTNSSEKTAK